MSQSNYKHFYITNASSTDLYNLKLSLKELNASLEQCTVIRKRGSLTFNAPISEITLGNFSPHESAHLHCQFTPACLLHSPEELLLFLTSDKCHSPTTVDVKLKSLLSITEL